MSLRRFSFSQRNEMTEFFDENGFVILSDGLTKEAIQDFEKELRNIINSHLEKALLLTHPDENVFTKGLQSLENRDHEFVACVYDTVFQSPAFFRIAGDRRVEDAIKHLLKVDDTHALYGYTNRCLFAPPTDERRTYGWHQEVYYTVPHACYLQTWAPLIYDTTVQTGTIEVRPGSHKEGVAKQRWYDIPGRSAQILIDDDILKEYPAVQVEMKLGELMIFSGHLAHRSGVNSSDKVRYSLVGMYHDVRHPPFRTPRLEFKYRGQTPREYYEETQEVES